MTSSALGSPPMPSIMQSKWLRAAVAALFWLGMWELAARQLALPFAVPTVGATLRALIQLAGTQLFWLTIGASLWRILQGLLLGTLLGALLAGLSVVSPLLDAIIRPAQTVIRCTPVASFIMVLWIVAGRDAVPAAIAVLMVLPVVWQSLVDGYRTLDPTLDDVVRVFHASFWQRLTMYVVPGLRASFVTALVTSAGLAWKAGIAAEIIAYTAHSIGRSIADARNLFDGAGMMAWTMTVVLLSLIMETAIRAALKYDRNHP